jgi:ribonuclease BN (tRNA processing enzyme)
MNRAFERGVPGHGVNRRGFLNRVAAIGAGALLPLTARPSVYAQSAAATPAMRLILLGTGGGPSPKKNVSAPAQAIVIGDALYVVDCGDGVARQLVRAGLRLTNLRHVFITHHHSDHNADYGNLLLLAWGDSLSTDVHTWGPPPLTKMTDLFLQMSDEDIRVRLHDEGRPQLRPLIHAHDVAAGGLVMKDDLVTVTAAVVPHPEMPLAFAYRFDGPGRSIVISGDTARSDALIELARGADVLVHEAMWGPAVDRLAARYREASRLRQHLIDSHTVAEDCGRVAQAAGVKTLVLSHFVPGDDDTITERMWADAAAAHFSGRVIVGRDLMEV